MTDEFLKPWENIATSDGLAEKELAREAPKGHTLYGTPVRAIGYREYDDYLFELFDGTGRVAVVHLTWAKERDPIWPFTYVYDGIEHWKTECMEKDHEEWLEEQ